MAIIKNPEDLNNAANYVATIAFFCCIPCVILMLRFGGFKASLNIFNSKKNKESNNVDPGLYINGAYRTNRNEFYGNGRLSDPPRKLTPSMVTLPPCNENLTAVRPTKSTSDLTTANSTQQTRHNKPNVSADSRGGDGDKITTNSRHNDRNHDKDQKRLEKQKLQEQREREKAAAKEQAKLERMQEKAKKEAQSKRDKSKRDKRKAPAPQPVKSNPLAQSTVPRPDLTNSVTKTNIAYPTNTLESSISRSSGPPPYSERAPTDTEQSATSSNIIFSKPIDTSSWDMISEHRQQVSRITNDEKRHNKQTVMDLNYNFSTAIQEERDNSEV